MPVYRQIPNVAYRCGSVALKHVVFAPQPFTVIAENDGIRGYATLIGWEGNRQVFLSPNGFPAHLPGWSVETIWNDGKPAI